MSREWIDWWMNRAGDTAAATVTPSQPVPMFGPSLDIGTGRLTPQQYEDAVNAIQTFSDDTNVQNQTRQQALTPYERAQAEELEEKQERLREVRKRLEILEEGGETETTATSGGQHTFGVQKTEYGELKDELARLEQDLEIRPRERGLWDALSGVDEKTGLNRTERKWLEAQAGQDSDIRGAQHDAELFPELRGEASSALRSGEWTERLMAAYQAYQARDLTNKPMQALEAVEEHVYQPWVARPISTALQVTGSAEEGESLGSTLLDAGEWRESWERAENITPGQAFADPIFMSREEHDEAYASGFDEFGNPLNQAYFDVRREAGYNVTSGVTDFAVRWYADPLVVGGKIAGGVRSVQKADWDRMPAFARRRIEHIVTTPNERWAEMKASISKLDPIGQRAVRLREHMDDLTAKVRSDPATYDEVWLAENVPAFKDDLLAAGLWRESALRTRQQFNPKTGQWETAMRDARTPEEINASRLELDRQLLEDPTRVQISGNLRLHRVDPDWDPKGNRPEGQYYTPVWEEDFHSIYKNDFQWRGEEHWAVGHHEKILKIPQQQVDDLEREGGVFLTPGQHAIAHLAGNDELERIGSMEFWRIREEIQEKFPHLDLDTAASPRVSRTYYEEIYGAELARQRGYDGILLPDYAAMGDRSKIESLLANLKRETITEEHREDLLRRLDETRASARRDGSEFVDLTQGEKVEDMGSNASQVLAGEKLAPVFDDEVQEITRAALFGNGKARTELAARAEIDDYFTALTSDKLNALQESIERSKHLDELADLTPAQRWERSVLNNRTSMQDNKKRVEELEGQLAVYDSYHRFVNSVLESPDAAVLRSGQFKPKPRKGNAITRHTFRPSKAAGVGATVTTVPRSAWLKRSQAVDLSGHGSIQEQLPRYMDEVTKGVGDADHLHAVATKYEYGSWNELRRDLANRAARARSDVDRRAVMQRAEEISIEAIAGKHGLTPDDALKVGARLRDKRGEIFAEARRQAADRKAAGVDEDDITRFTYSDGADLHTVDMPVSLTQLQNWYIPADVRVLDSLLRRQGDGIKAALYNLGDLGTEGLEVFNAVWKPAVLFRFGYPARTVSEESFRILAHTGSFQNLLQDMPKALGTGVVNTGKRVGNFAFRHFFHKKKWEGAKFHVKTQQEVYGDDAIVRGRRFSGALAMGKGDLMEAQVSAGESLARLNLNFKGTLAELHKGQFPLRKTLEGEQGHAEAWQHVLNNQVLYDPMRVRILAGETDEQIVRWLRREPEGREYARRMAFRSHNPEKWVAENRQELDTLVPDDVLRTKLVNGEKVELHELEQRVADQNVVSPVSIDEAALQLTFGQGKLAETYNKIVTGFYRVLAEIPTNVLARNPFFNRQYRAHLARQSESIADDLVLTERQVAAMERQARQHALKQTRRYLFNLADETDLVHYMRFIAPFMGAWKESMSAWGRIFTENPEAFVRLGVNGWMSMGDLWFVEEVDMEGRTADDPDHGELDTLMVNMPKGAVSALGKLIPGFDPDTVGVLAGEDGAVRMPVKKQTLNTTLQGDPFWLPGLGVPVQIAGSWAVSDQPELADQNAFSSFMHKYVFPVGVPRDIWDAMLPTAYQRMRRQYEGINDPVFANSPTLIYKTMLFNWQQGDQAEPKPKPEEALEMAKSLQAMYIAGGIFSPFSFQLQPESQFYVDMAHKYQDEYGFEDGYTRFIEDFGEDAYLFWYSNSRSNTGVPPTSEGWKMQKKHRDLVEQYPDIGLAIVGMNTRESPFNYSVYEQQRRQPISELDTRLQRESGSPAEAVARAETSEGWNEWRRFNTTVDAELAARGLRNIQQAGAQDLAQIKYNFTQELRRKYPGWSREYDQIDKGRAYEIVGQFRSVLESGRAPDRIEWEGVAEYLTLWDTVAAELDARRQAGGSSDIGAETNADVKAVFDGEVGRIVNSNLAFADVYHRFLENAELTDGSHGGANE